ncbi:MAG TPA: hypothetical protein ENK80_05605, partial [Rhodobacterales bacterium]|nr:hypothetical protein [Rhodobacterales bacterium]
MMRRFLSAPAHVFAHLALPSLALASLVLVSAVMFAGAGLAQGHVYTVYQKNMAFGNNRERALANDILSRRPDVVTLQEVNRDNDKLLRMIEGSYPAQHWCWFDGIGGVAVASRWPIVQGTADCIRPLGATAIQVQGPEGKLWAISLHLETRDKPRHKRQAQKLGQVLSTVRGPMIIGGDFNDLAQSGPVRDVSRGAGVARVGKAISSVTVGGLLGVPIDFVCATGGRGETAKLPLLGSDHYGIWARFTMN